MTARFSARTAFGQEPNRLAARRAELEQAGRELVDLTVTDPTECGLDLISPRLPEVRRYAPDAQGWRPAREALAALYTVAPEQLVLSASTSEAYGWLFKVLCDPGDEVLTPAPCYPLFEYLARLEGVAARSWPLQCSAGRFELDLGLLEASATPRTRAVLLVSPANPTGQVLRADELTGAAELCARRGWALVVDEVFHDATRHGLPVSGRPLPCLTFGLGGLSKLAGLPQLKLAWTVVSGPPAVTRAAVERLALVADTSLSVSTPVQHAAPDLLAQRGRFLAAVAERVAANAAVLRALQGPAARWECLPVEGGWSQPIRIGAQPGEEQVCLAALERGVVTHPGYFYDFPSGAWLVVSLLPEPGRFREGARRLAGALADG